jgi:hypothetical protein
MIVPNFDMDILAVRTKQSTPRTETSDWRHERFPQAGQSLPMGEGRYVDETPLVEEDSWTEKNAQGKDVEKICRFPVEFDEELTFPVALVQPHILAETQRALGYKLFDQVGIARGRHVSSSARRDPIVLGRIFDRTRPNHCLTFFVSWWLDREMV